MIAATLLSFFFSETAHERAQIYKYKQYIFIGEMLER